MDICDGSHVIIVVVYETCSGGPEAALRSQIPDPGEPMHIVKTYLFNNRVFSENEHTVQARVSLLRNEHGVSTRASF
jgi:hypothetical protein